MISMKLNTVYNIWIFVIILSPSKMLQLKGLETTQIDLIIHHFLQDLENDVLSQSDSFKIVLSSLDNGILDGDNRI